MKGVKMNAKFWEMFSTNVLLWYFSTNNIFGENVLSTTQQSMSWKFDNGGPDRPVGKNSLDKLPFGQKSALDLV